MVPNQIIKINFFPWDKGLYLGWNNYHISDIKTVMIYIHFKNTYDKGKKNGNVKRY